LTPGNRAGPITATIGDMKPFDSSPCRDFDLVPAGNAHPCLEPGWGDRPCPMNSGCGERLHACAERMYRLGYPYATWVVRRTWFGLRHECTLQFLRERPGTDAPETRYGPGVLRVSPATF
jgi:hypothetical protein